VTISKPAPGGCWPAPATSRMGAFADLRRGFRAGLRGSPASQENDGGFAFGDDELAECKAIIADLTEENASLKAAITELASERDRTPAHTRELETIIAFPGVKNALFKALHPDTGTGGNVQSRTAIFQTLMNVLERLGLGR
jgi:hypothetical protein